MSGYWETKFGEFIEVLIVGALLFAYLGVTHILAWRRRRKLNADARALSDRLRADRAGRVAARADFKVLRK